MLREDQIPRELIDEINLFFTPIRQSWLTGRPRPMSNIDRVREVANLIRIANKFAEFEQTGEIIQATGGSDHG
jgi:hypothetical protein